VALHIRKGDLVRVISGSDRGKEGRVIAVDPKRRQVRVQKVRMLKRHLRAGRRGTRTGGIVEQEGSIDISNVMLIDPSDHRPARVRTEVRDGKRVRVFTRSGDPVPDPTAR
jgi:large subunit ribosomal protein L24